MWQPAFGQTYAGIPRPTMYLASLAPSIAIECYSLVISQLPLHLEQILVHIFIDIDLILTLHIAGTLREASGSTAVLHHVVRYITNR
jgi:hypothetical protein